MVLRGIRRKVTKIFIRWTKNMRRNQKKESQDVEAGPSTDNQSTQGGEPLADLPLGPISDMTSEAGSPAPQVTHTTTADLPQGPTSDTASAQCGSPTSQAAYRTTDPHILITLASQAIGMSVDVSPLRHQKITPLSNRIVKDEKRGRRQLVIMDALAAVAICEAKGQVVAISLQVDHENRAITLGVAGNGKVPTKVVDHLTELWERLSSLSAEYKRGRREVDLYDWESHHGESLPIPTVLGEDGRTDIVKLVYTFSIKKVARRYTKWWRKLWDLYQEYRTCYDKLTGSDIPEFDDRFVKMMVNLNAGVGFLIKLNQGGLSLARQDWRNFASDTSEALDISKEIIHAVWGQIGEDLGWRANGNSYTFEHALGKLFTMEHAIRSLVAFASSSRLRAGFMYDRTVQAVPPARPASVKLPESVAEWCSVVESVCQGYQAVGQSQARTIAQKLLKGTQILEVHAECNLINFLETDGSSTPALSYIGVSKLCCQPCQIWIEAVNHVAKKNYSVKGTHEKWYPSWGMPSGTDGLVRTEVGRRAQVAFLEHLLRKGDLRAASDSTHCSSAGVRLERSEEEKERTARRSAKFELAFRAPGFKPTFFR